MTEPPRAATPNPNDDEIDLIELAWYLWSRRILIGSLILLGTALSFLYAMTRPKTFTSSVLMVPTESPNNSQLGAAASLLGRKGAGQADVDLYQSLLVSRTVIGEVLRAKIPDRSDSGNGRIRTIAQVMRIDTNNARKMEAILRSLPGSIKVETEKTGSSGMIEVQVKSRQPWLAQSLANELVKAGQHEIRRVRAQRSDAILERLGGAVKAQESEWDRASQKLLDFRLANRATNSPVLQRDEDRLQLELQSKQQSLLLARNQYQQQLLDREKAAPPMVILDSANLPVKKSGPKRMLLLLGGIILFSAGTVSSFVAVWLVSSARRIRRPKD